MEEKAKFSEILHSPIKGESEEKTEDVSKLRDQLEAIKLVMEENREVLQRLADS